MSIDPTSFSAPINYEDLKEDMDTLLAGALERVEYARHNDLERLSQALAVYTRLLARNHEYSRASEIAHEILAIEQNTPSAVEALIALGICAGYTNDIDASEQHFHAAMLLSRKIRYRLGLARALQYMTSLVLLIRGQFHLALTYTEEAGLLRQELGARQWNEPYTRGTIYQIVGDRRHAREVLDELILQIEPGSRLAAAYYLLWARVALDEVDLQQAKEYLRLGLRVANRVDVMELNLLTRLEHSRLHRLLQEPAVARDWANDALLQAQQYHSQYFQALALIERAQANWASGEQSAASSDLDSACALLKPLRANYDIARASFLRALWQKQMEHPEAEATWLDAAQLIGSNGFAFLLEKEQETAFPLVVEYMRSKNHRVREATETLMGYLADVLPPPLRIETLGQFSIWKGRYRLADASFNRRKSGELLRFLLLQNNRAAGRELIIEALWPEAASDNPSNLLNQATSNLRHALEPHLPDKFPSRYLKVEGELISLRLPPGSSVDFEHFERVLPIAIQTHSAERLQEALKLYAGELFPADRYADWSEEKRQELKDLWQRGMLALAKIYLDNGQNYLAINCCRQVLHSDPWNEEAALMGMQAYIGLNDIPHALQVYQALEKTLREDLDTIPGADLRTLAEKIRRR